MPDPIPFAALDGHTAILGTTGAGKTVTAKGHVEALLDAGRHLCVLDPTGAWYGLRSAADGEGAGFDIPIFGGPHGDVPVTADQGEAVGAIIAGGVSAVVDISSMSTGAEQRRFARDLLRRLRAKSGGNFHLIVDEADEFAAQKPRDDFGFQVGEELIWMAKRGRLAGFVLTLITQRPASIDKDVLTQAQTLIIHQLLAPVDQKPVLDYLKDHADRATLATVKASLAGLSRGERWIYSPRAGMLERGVSPMPRTFDSSRTPEAGERAVEPKMLASIDIAAIREALAPAVVTADPEEAHGAGNAVGALLAEKDAEIARLRLAEVAAYETGKTAGIAIGIVRCREAINALRLPEINEVSPAASAIVGTAPVAAANSGGDDVAGSAVRASTIEPKGRRPAVDKAADGASPSGARRRPDTDTIPPRWQRILDAIAWASAMLGRSEAERNIVAWFADTSPKSSGYQNDLGAMRTRGLIDYPSAGMLALTATGEAVANWPVETPTRDDLFEAICAKLEPRHRRILAALFKTAGRMSRAELAERASTSAGSSGFQNDLGKLRTLGLLDYPQPGFVGLGRVLA